jgi:hypothetical protein
VPAFAGTGSGRGPHFKMSLPIKILVIGNIKKDDAILLRKKFAGAKPYPETWYSFGCELKPEENPADTFVQYIKEYLGVIATPLNHLSWDFETKIDHDGAQKFFIYLEIECEYVSGDIRTPNELEKVEFVSFDDLSKLDIVPPSVKMFKHLGYIK